MFSIRFFFLAVVFLIFDVEIRLLLPLVVARRGRVPLVWRGVGGLFLSLLILGAGFEWWKGALD